MSRRIKYSGHIWDWIRCIQVICLVVLTGGAVALEWDLAELGAVGDGKTDNTTIFQKALDDAGAAGGGTVKVPTGEFRFDGNLTIPFSVCLQGTYSCPPTVEPGEAPKIFSGTTFLVYGGRGSNEEPAFIRLAGKMAALRGVIIRYPEARYDETPPAPYPPAILVNQWSTLVENCCILNAYEGIRIREGGRHTIRNILGYPTWRGMYIDWVQDVGRIENVHFSPMGFPFDPKGKYMRWVFENGTAFELAQSDWQFMSNTFCFGYRNGYKFSKSKMGVVNGNFLGIAADCCQRPVLVEHASNAGLLITNGEFVGQWDTVNSIGVDVGPECDGVIQLSNCSFWGPFDRLVRVRGAKAKLVLSSSNLTEWDNDGDDSEAIQLDAGRAIIQGCFFREAVKHAWVGADVTAATFIGNQAEAGFNVENLAGARLRMVGNEEDLLTWTEEAKSHYRIDIGAPGDSRCLRQWGWGGPAVEWKTIPQGTRRWAKPGSLLRIPMIPGRSYTLEMDIYVPEEAVKPSNGFYMDDALLYSFDVPGFHLISIPIPPRQSGWAELAIRGEALSSSHEKTPFQLLIASRWIEMTADGAEERCFDANTGIWGEAAPEEK